jgi:hypothetical protein
MAQVYTFSITGNIMIRTMIAKPTYNKTLYKAGDTKGSKYFLIKNKIILIN